MAHTHKRAALMERIVDGLDSWRRSRRPLRVKVGSSAKRVQAAILVCGFLASIVAGCAINIQVFDPKAYAQAAVSELTTTRELPANRGNITDRFGTPLAMSVPAVTVAADPAFIATNGKLDAEMSEKDEVAAAAAPALIADVLSKHLGEDPSVYLAKLTKRDLRYVVLGEMVMASVYQDIVKDLNAKDLIGVYRVQTPYRTYPNGALASNVLGYVNADGIGSGGLEYWLDSTLTGTPGLEVYEASPNGRIPLGANVVTAAQNGTSYQLTLDAELQWTLESMLASQVKTSGGKSGMGIVMNVKTGEILAMANTNTFDSNAPGKAKPENLGNDAAMKAFEPGSVEKLVTMAALLDTGKITPETRVVVPNTIMSGGEPIKDAWSHSTLYLTARGVLAKSSNVGTIKLARKLDKQTFVNYLERLGFGKKTGLPLSGEGTGSIPTARMTDQTRDQISFGQGMSVTAIQEAAAVAALVNGGVYHQPTIVKSATDGDGNAVNVSQSAAKRVVTAKTSAYIRDMMEAMMKASGSGKASLGVEGFRSGTKTGTAQKIDEKCHCYRGGFVTSVIGTAPIEDPSILTYIVIDTPGKGYESGHVAAGPAYTDIMQLALIRYGIPQSTTSSPNRPITYKS